MASNKKLAHRESLRQEILDAARPLFVRNGYESTSIRKIASKLGCSPGILYHYFEDKDAIMSALIREAFAKLLERLRPLVNDTSPVRDRLRRGLRSYIDFGLENPNHYSVLFRKPDDVTEKAELQQVLHAEGSACFGCLRDMCRQALQAGEFRPELNDVEEIAQTLWMGIHGSVSIRIGARGFPFLEKDRLTDRLIDVLLHGVMRS